MCDTSCRPGERTPPPPRSDAQRRRVPTHTPRPGAARASPSIGVGAPAQQDAETLQGARVARAGRQMHRRRAILQHQAGVGAAAQQLLHSPAADGDVRPPPCRTPRDPEDTPPAPPSPRLLLAQGRQQSPGRSGHVLAESPPSGFKFARQPLRARGPAPRLPSSASGPRPSGALGGQARPRTADKDRGVL